MSTPEGNESIGSLLLRLVVLAGVLAIVPADLSAQAPDYNVGLKGRIWIADEGHYLDLDTGEYVALSPDDVDVSIHPSANGTEYVETVENCERVRMALSRDCVNIRSVASGLVVQSFKVFEAISGPARLSPDGTRVAAIWTNEGIGEGSGDSRVSLFTRAGELLSRSAQTGIYDMGWLPDGRIVYTSGRSIYVTSGPDSARGTRIRTFSESEGRPTYLSVSPHGRSIAFELTTEFGPAFVRWRNSTMWVTDPSGATLRQVATAEDDGRIRVNNPAWSPDGNTLVAVEGHISGAVQVPAPFSPGEWTWEAVGVSGSLYAVPGDGVGTLLPPVQGSPARPVFERLNDGRAGFVRPGIFSNLRWLPPMPAAQEARGTLPVPTGSNQGLQGTFYYDDDGVEDSTAAWGLRLEGGSRDRLFKLTDDDLDNVSDTLYVSRDETRFAHYYDESSRSALRVYDGVGATLASLPLETDNYEIRPTGAIRFSPVNPNHVLVRFFDGESGENFAKRHVVVVDWAARRFVRFFRDHEYVGADWTPRGDIVLSDDKGGVYRSDRLGAGWNPPSLLFQRRDPARDLVVSPGGTYIAMAMAGRIWTSRLNGTESRRLTGWSDGFEVLPEWSSDGAQIAFKTVDTDDQSGASGRIWVVAADAGNVRVRRLDNTPNAIPVLLADGEQLRIFGTFGWRSDLRPSEPDRPAGAPWLAPMLIMLDDDD